MIQELFEKAEFGDRFVTRGGQEALFLRLTENSEWKFADFYVKEWGQIRVNRENGKCLNDKHTENDIVGVMPSIPSDLDMAAEEYSENILANNEDLQDAIEDAFKEGAKWMVEHGETEVELEKLKNKAELIANEIMMGVQANKYHTCIYDKASNDFNHSHLLRAALKGLELGLNARKEKAK